MPNRYTSYDSPSFSRKPLGSGGLAGIIVLLLFAMLPFTQYLASLQKQDATVRQFDIAPPPPQFTPPEPPPPQEEPPPDEPPQMDQPPPQLSLSQLNMSVNPGVGNALAGDFALGDVAVDADETVEQISLFEISDLDETPRNMTSRGPTYPDRLMRSRIEGEVTLACRIMEDGRVELIQVVSSSRPEFAEAATSWVERFVRYSKPTVNGEPVQAKLTLTIPFKLQ